MSLTNDVVPDSYNEALGEAQGIVWKASSGAEYEGVPIMDWTSKCVGGVLTAYAIRASGLIMADGDVYRIVERAVQASETALVHVEHFLLTPWPIFGVLHVWSLLKKSYMDVRLAPGDLALGRVLSRCRPRRDSRILPTQLLGIRLYRFEPFGRRMLV